MKGILVNIFGGIMKCDVIARGVIAAVKAVGLQVPLVVRLEGTNVEQGKQILRDFGAERDPGGRSGRCGAEDCGSGEGISAFRCAVTAAALHTSVFVAQASDALEQHVWLTFKGFCLSRGSLCREGYGGSEGVSEPIREVWTPDQGLRRGA